MGSKVATIHGANIDQATVLSNPVVNDDVVTSLSALLELAKSGKIRSMVVMGLGSESVYYHASGNYQNDSLTLLGLTEKARADLMAATGF
ncbi:MAG: hypothetical protein ACKVJE_21890 [Pseudomonadales bacterium]